MAVDVKEGAVVIGALKLEPLRQQCRVLRTPGGDFYEFWGDGFATVRYQVEAFDYALEQAKACAQSELAPGIKAPSLPDDLKRGQE